ncbi:MAG: hypothetical protein IPH23_12280 [Gammaproteobacteria bacterium]|nr:hypothetical protein [Gammaproteobacteria bacterium]
MLGPFMVLPVLALNEAQYTGATAATIGLRLGIYGLTCRHVVNPFGLASDRFGRKPLIITGIPLSGRAR